MGSELLLSEREARREALQAKERKQHNTPQQIGLQIAQMCREPEEYTNAVILMKRGDG